MTVEELLNRLKDLDPNLIVYIPTHETQCGYHSVTTLEESYGELILD